SLQRDVVDVAILGRKPALQPEEAWQDIVVELLRVAPCKRGAYPAVTRRQRYELRQDLRHRKMPLRRGSLFGEQEPVEAIARQGNEIWQVANGREWRTARQFDRYRAFPLRQIQFNRLCGRR